MQKKGLRIVALLLATWMVLGCLSGCSVSSKLLGMEESERALEAYSLINEKMQTFSSYSSEQILEMSTDQDYYVQQYKIVSKTTAANIGKNNYSHLTETVISNERHTEYDVSGGDILTCTEGFQNGKMFLSSKMKSGEKNKIYSELSATEYVQHRKDTKLDVILDITEGSCENKRCVQNQDQGWEITFSEFTDDAIRCIALQLGGVDQLLEDNILIDDMTLTMECDKKMVASRMEIIFHLKFVEKAEESEETEQDVKEKPLPELQLSVNYRDVNQTTPAEEIDFDDYTKIQDMRVLDRLNKALQDRQAAEKGSITLSTTMRVGSGSKEIMSGEDAKISYSMKNGRLTYDMDSKTVATGVSAQSVSVRYEDGKKSVFAGAVSQVTESEDEIERRMIQSLSQCTMYSPAYVSDMEKESSGVYCLTLSYTDLSSLTSTISSKTEITDATLTVSFDGDELIKWEFCLEGTSNGVKVFYRYFCRYTNNVEE